MGHIAYDVKELVKACPVKIESVTCWGSRLLISCIDGSLRIYCPESDRPDPLEKDADSFPAIKKSDTFALQNTLIGFSKKPITSMTVAHSRNLLITLSDAIVVHKLPGLDTVAYLANSKGATLYAWDEKQGLLCVARQKRLLIYQHNGSRDFTELKELAAPDVVKSIAWCGESVCLGIRREYVIVNTTTGLAIELFPCGRIASPLILPLLNGELLLGKDNVGVFVDQNGKLTHPGGITWSEVPSLVVINPPYALAWLSRFIEVRYLQPPCSLVQMISLREMQLLPMGNHVVVSGPQVIASSDHAVHALLLVPLGAQIVQLTASRSFKEALALCKLLPQEDAALRANKEDDIHRRYGQFLFEQKEYADSLQHFAASSMNLTEVLSFFPLISLPRFYISIGRSHFLSSTGSENLDESPQLSGEWEDAEKEENRNSFTERERISGMTALAAYLTSIRTSIVSKAEAEDTDAAVAALVNHTGSTAAGDLEKHTKFSTKFNESAPGTEKKYSSKEWAIILDTALVQAQLLSQQSSAALDLLTKPNYCDVEACEAIMTQGSYFRELLQLYEYNQLHRKVLGLLNQLVEGKESSEEPQVATKQVGPEEIIEYLKKLGGQDPFLILESSVWLLKTCPEQAMGAYTSMDPPLPADTVNKYLKEKFPELRVLYLEHLMKHDNEKFKADLQNELVTIYLAEVLEECSKLQEESSWDEHKHIEVRQKLLGMLRNCTGYSSENLLKHLPNDGLYEERATLLGRLGQHQLALTLYAHKLHDSELALKYCDDVFVASTANINGTNSNTATRRPSEKAAANVYLTLLQVYLKPNAAVREYDRSVASLDFTNKFASQRTSIAHRTKGHVARKVAQIEGADDNRQSVSSESTAESGKSDGEDNLQYNLNIGNERERSDREGEKVMLDEALDLLSCRWNRIDGAQALTLLPGDTKLQRLYPFLEPLLRKSSEERRNLSVIKNLCQSESLQVRNELQKCRKRMVKITNENTCSICSKKIGMSVFAVYPTGTIVHFVCYKDQKGNKTIPTSVNMY
ncbi:hypothetical protein GOP47_0001912 [Adiantum capillus-veneris]|uniref:CNH domain-containing protein n=1 Tax=Adiantum capillus-veneris TaxID=13818 RepID=A0A9D4V9B6_ADICA|nr:hypothetical protein GOP47_0001912 [Adiantum capillus-veneris]